MTVDVGTGEYHSAYNIRPHVLFKANDELVKKVGGFEGLLLLGDDIVEQIRKISVYYNMNDLEAYLKWSQGR